MKHPERGFRHATAEVLRALAEVVGETINTETWVETGGTAPFISSSRPEKMFTGWSTIITVKVMWLHGAGADGCICHQRLR